MLDVVFMGYVVKVYYSVDFENIVIFFYFLYDEMLVDWLIIFWWCIKYYDNYILFLVLFFQYIGDNFLFFENKLFYKLKEKYFDQYDIKYRGLNLLVSVSSFMIGFLEIKFENVYNKGIGYFWVKEVKKDDYIFIMFMLVIFVCEVFVDMGFLIVYEDQFKLGVLQVSYQINEEIMGYCIDFEIIGEFKFGKVKVLLILGRKFLCLRILVIDS